jgi:hypothetical protein
VEGSVALLALNPPRASPRPAWPQMHVFCAVVGLTFKVLPAAYASSLWAGVLFVYYMLTGFGEPEHTGEPASPGPRHLCILARHFLNVPGLAVLAATLCCCAAHNLGTPHTCQPRQPQVRSLPLAPCSSRSLARPFNCTCRSMCAWSSGGEGILAGGRARNQAMHQQACARCAVPCRAAGVGVVPGVDGACAGVCAALLAGVL